ncbi:MAG: polysaccharide biosynthesis protein [Clostridia bacterium]|nr:polysaccharide biosynthesis protein [Clostridia bacterium]MBQ4543104.1 polysaccharide biosynthesis protein [Clostridia bacterium]
MISAEKLLNRKPLQFNMESSARLLKGKTVIVTGGSGSIGSELCIQIHKAEPKKLVILDINENNSYMLYKKLGMADNVKIEIANIREREKVFSLFRKYKPDFVFHAAAHKHVPLMEECPDEAVKNNIFGTLNVMDACVDCEVKKMILISTDKAANPKSVMGATKRFCEMMIQSKSSAKTVFSAVRFGNVLGSDGSVIPIFLQQIDAGGPVTITDKNITRFFMTVTEAVGLILETTVFASQGEIYVLDMGESISILTLAENLIKLKGYAPYQDIDIIETGMRTGEKLHEQLLINPAAAEKSQNKSIMIDGKQVFNSQDIDKKLDLLRNSLSKTNENIKETLKKSID